MQKIKIKLNMHSCPYILSELLGTSSIGVCLDL